MVPAWFDSHFRISVIHIQKSAYDLREQNFTGIRRVDKDLARRVVIANAEVIERAAAEFRLNPDFLRAVIYTENAHGYYDKYLPRAKTIRPGNVGKRWEVIIPDSDITKPEDNIRVAAKLLAAIVKRLDVPFPEDVYSLYNSLAHDRTYQNKDTLNTPLFLRQALKDKAWTQPDWNADRVWGDDEVRPPSRMRDELISDRPMYRPDDVGGIRKKKLPGGFEILQPGSFERSLIRDGRRAGRSQTRTTIVHRARAAWETDRSISEAGNLSTEPALRKRKAELDRLMDTGNRAYWGNAAVQSEYRRILTALDGHAERRKRSPRPVLRFFG